VGGAHGEAGGEVGVETGVVAALDDGDGVGEEGGDGADLHLCHRCLRYSGLQNGYQIPLNLLVKERQTRTLDEVVCAGQ